MRVPHIEIIFPRGRAYTCVTAKKVLDKRALSTYNKKAVSGSAGTVFRGVAQMVARMVRDHEAASSSLATPTMRSVLIGSEYPTKDTPHFLLSKSGRRRFHRTAADPGCTGALPCAG